jgi:hypothetical protein
MPPPELSAVLERYAAGQSRPATFLERGVTLPFTTPLLLGGRIRPAERGAAELVLANPAGTDGVYVLPWAGILDFCTPSLHDRALWARVSELSLLVPRKVRDAAQQVAREGYAGRAAARAAERSCEEARHHRTVVQYGLLLELVRQGELVVEGAASLARRPPPETDTPANVQARAEAVLDRLRRDGRISALAALDSIEELAEAFEVCGLRRGVGTGRLPTLAAAMTTMAAELAEAAAGDASPTERLCQRLLSQSAELVLRCGRLALADAHGLTEDIWTLLQRWRTAPESVQAAIGRAEWIFDGWEVIAGIWRGAAPEERGAAAVEMARLVPMIPAEVKDWLGFDAPGDMEAFRSGLRRWRHTVRAHEDWMTGRITDAASRTEQLRAMLCT